ncbi:RING-H2 finger protein ATL3-like [Senna tora]|uniref:RING-type E3 ubiquitin transferase n=1 Tax=Senna tora TaxID=362788 RepID=A0A834XG64_9FABA|nr:RING-H2 finger protein ATL3-like [Senna tora]
MGDLSGAANNKLDDSAAVQITGKIMVAAIIVLFFVVVIVCFLHLYAKWFWWRIEESSSTTPDLRNRRRRRRQRFVFAGQDPAIYGAQRRGIEPEVLRSIPVLVYQPEDFKEGLECAVCLCELAQGEKARLLPKCNHGFHVECIDMWFQSHSTCPLCRNPVASESSKSCCSSGVRENASESNNNNSESSSDSDSSDAMSELDLESPNFPTNVLIWGNQTQVSSNGEGASLQAPSSSSSSSTAGSSSNGNHRRQGMLVIDIPREINPSSLSPSTSRFAEDHDLKSPVTSRLKSFKRILSLKFSPRSPSSVDVEQGGRAQN